MENERGLTREGDEAIMSYFSFPHGTHITSRLCRECAAINFVKLFSNPQGYETHTNPFSVNQGVSVMSQENAFRVPLKQMMDKVLKEKSRPFGYGQVVANLGSRLSPTSSCPLCRFLWLCRLQDVPTEPTEYEHELHAYCQYLKRNFGPDQETKGEHYAFLGVLLKPEWADRKDVKWRFNPPCLITPATPKDAPFTMNGAPKIWGRETGQAANMELSRHWLETCVSTHKHCQWRTQDSGQTAKLGNFRLIDCSLNTPVIEVRSLTESYAALSYVWGKSTASMSDTAATWPKTVLDAITTTRELGLRYLWVDKYCINQDDAAEKSMQISQMDLIYKMAEVTLIAAAGSDASFGLAGIDGTMRYPNVKIQLPNGLVLVSTRGEPDLKVAGSPWNSRGWTYQEGLFARRRLYFLPDQMYWQCRGFEAQESFQFPYKTIHEGVLRCWDLKIPFLEFDVHTDIFRCYSNHISEFSSRSLTFDSDVLAACRSLSINLTSQPGSNLSVLLGLPVSTLGYKATCIPREPIAFALTGWCHIDQHTGEAAPGLILPSTVLHDKSFSVERRTRFPSWSWAGWTGRVKFMNPRVEYDIHRMRANQRASGFEREQEALIRILDQQYSIYLRLRKGMGFPLIEPEEQLVWCEDFSFEASSQEYMLDIHGSRIMADLFSPGSSVPAAGGTASRIQASPVLRVHKPYVLPAWHKFGRGIVNLQQGGSKPDIVALGHDLWLGNCMFLFLSSDRARFQKQADFFKAIGDGYICCILLCMSPWDTWAPQMITGRFLVLRSMTSKANPCDGRNDVVRMWERIGVLRVQVMTPSYAGFLEVLETCGMKMDDQDYRII
ncbi:heterokaryon incompatibility protein-domain-containing protein [Xylaria telfairii]|nr:heterokaryon incompatibility protein-domain-containing protein [Xylaria telfairii]